MCKPKIGWRHVEVSDRQTKFDFAEQMKYLIDKVFPETEKICVVKGNLSMDSAEPSMTDLL